MLVIAPHPDDEVLGCGGIMRKMSGDGVNVFVLVITRGKPSLYTEDQIENVRNEARNAHDLLGVRETVFLDFPAPDLDLVSGAELSTEIGNHIKEKNIDTLYLPHRGDIHHDHTAVFNAGIVAARPVNNNPVKWIFSYETLSETEWAPPFPDDQFHPTTFVDISAEMEAKLEAMKCFKSQLKKFPNPRSVETIEALATFRGSTVGFGRAEAFMTLRQILD